jgi:hypothetical protein
MGILSSLFGIGGSKPSTSTVVQQQNIPPELAPFIKEILGEAQTLYQADIERGYDPYTGLTTAPFTPEQEAAQEGISGLVGTTAPFLAEAFDIYERGGEKFTPEVAAEYMSPYQRAVTDIEKREAQTQFERNVLPRFEASAVEAGGMSGLGTRAGVEGAEIQRGQSQLLADIEAKGLQSSFQNAQAQFAQQKAREQQMAGNIGRTGPALFQAGLAERGAQMGVGEQKREAAQSELDEAYFKFLEERGFPQQTLADYSQTVYGSPLSKQPFPTTTSTTGTPFVSSPASQLMGLGLGGLNIYGMAGGWGAGGPSMQGLYSGAQKNPLAKEGGQVIPREEGGQINPRGLSGLPVVRRQVNAPVGNPQVGKRQWHTPVIQRDTQNTPTNYTDIIKNLLGKLTGGGDYSNPSALRNTIGADINQLDYFNKDKRSIPYKIRDTEIKNEAKLAKERRENIRDTSSAATQEARSDYVTKRKEEADKVNIGGDVGTFLKDLAAGKHKEGMTPIEILAGTLSAGAESAGRQMEEGRKEKTELDKEIYAEEKSDRVRASENLLKDSELEHAASVDLIKREFDLKEMIAGLPLKKQEYINNKINQQLKTENLGLAKINTAATLLKALGDLNKDKGGDKGGKSYVAAQRIMNNGVARKYEVLLSYDTQGNITGITKNGQRLDNNDPDFIRANRELYEKNKLFLDMLSVEGVKITQQDIVKAQNAAMQLPVFDPPSVVLTRLRDETLPLKRSDPARFKFIIGNFANKFYNNDARAAEAFLKYWVSENPQ